jgi:hypothetical protein
MLRSLLLLALCTAALDAKEIESKSMGIAVAFPDGAGWENVQKGSDPQKQATVLSDENDFLGQGLFFVVSRSDPEVEGKSFEECAAYWEKDMTSHEGPKLSSRQVRAGDHSAFEIVVSGRRGGQPAFIRCRFLRVGDYTYCLMVVGKVQARLSDEIANAFVESLRFTSPSAGG